MPQLPRAIGRWSLAALMVNAVIGSSVFGLPSVLAGRLGRAAPIAWLVAAAGIGVIVACFAEVASRFDQAGGPYLYARRAFGPALGLQMFWFAYLTRLTAAATNANLLILYLAELWPDVTDPLTGGVVLLTVIGGLMALNIRGVRRGAGASGILAAAKLVPLALFLLAGAAMWLSGRTGSPAPVTAGPAAWADAILLLMFAYGGFEGALMPLGEAREPRRDAPAALFGILILTTLLYTGVQLIILGVLPDPAASDRPLAAAAMVMAGRAGAVVMALAAILSVLGYLAGAMVNVPRLTFALAEEGDLPRVVGAVHPRFLTPWVSLVLYAALVAGLAVSGSFLQNLTLSAVSRLATYGMVCWALLVFRRREMPDVGEAVFTLPGGRGLAIAGLLLSVGLAARMTSREGVVMAVVLLAGLVHHLAIVRRSPAYSA